jgi:uncharacterized membrane protein
MIFELYALLTIVGLALFLSSYVWDSNPWIPAMAGLLFLALAPNSIYLTHADLVYNTTSDTTALSEYQISVGTDWIMYVWYAFFLVCLIEMIIRSLSLAGVLTSQEEDPELHTMGRHRL